MRLLELLPNDKFRLTDRFFEDVPRYAILSHTWGKECDELTFEDMSSGSGQDKTGYRKIEFCSRQAAKDRLRYFWIDSCCIKRSSDAELSESLNSMFRWYQRAEKCYVYLSDVSVSADGDMGTQSASETLWETAFQNSRWFTRGWTLQELLAPKSVQFYSREAALLGTKRSLAEQISQITGIPVAALDGTPLSQFDVAERMLWTKNRKTRREEDEAYCLFGIFDIFMSPIYGEGRKNALTRLQLEINKQAANSQSMESSSDPTDQGREDQRRKIFEKLTSVDTQATYIRHLEITQAGTGEWFFNGPFKQWIHSFPRSKILLLHGKSGAGKTILFSNAMSWLRKLQASTEHIAVAFFYCTRERDASQETLSVLGSYLVQLLASSPELYRQHESTFRRRVPNTVSELLNVLESACHKFKDVYICLDALNESLWGQEIGSALKRLVRKANNVHLFMTSTRVDITSQVDANMPTTFVHVNETAQQRDFRMYITARFAASSILNSLSDHLQGSIRETLLRDSDGMFRYVQCQCDRLASQRTVAAIRRELKNPPQGINEIYLAMLNHISRSNPDDRPIARETLMWLSFSPLTLDQLSDALAVQEGSSFIDPEDRLQSPDIILEICQGLITLNPRSRLVSLAHSSVLNFLLSDSLASSSASFFAFSPLEFCKTVLHKSLAYSMLEGLATGYCLTLEHKMLRSRQFPLFSCAAAWPRLVRQIEDLGAKLDDADLRQILTLFTTSSEPRKGNFGAFLSEFYPRPERDARGYETTEPLYAAASFGMTEVVESLLKLGPEVVDIEALGGRNNSRALQVAVYQNFCNTARLLLQYGAAPNATDVFGRSALFYAEYNRCMDCIQTLREYGGISL